jgi:hypothetical protein
MASVRELSQVKISTTIGSTNISQPLTDREINSIALGEAIRTINENR